ncbi:conserved hypothetical protein [Microcystis aeruginosa PCC 9808]|uniref:Uncharacterized protein n=1 Tax=Microcystis aeruginosa PCC 9808 TaxID=1160284 RepID=I4I0E0_MICAE|nr:conserved hypothetical protein [Microcystis aeruginosa PCC 9808]
MLDAPLIKGGLRGDLPPVYQGGRGRSKAKSIVYLIITTYLTDNMEISELKKGIEIVGSRLGKTQDYL